MIYKGSADTEATVFEEGATDNGSLTSSSADIAYIPASVQYGESLSASDFYFVAKTSGGKEQT